MIMSGFPVKSTQAQATSGNCPLWEEEKQAYLVCEKISLVDAVNHLGSDFVLDLTTSSLLQNIEPEIEEIAINIPETTGEIRTISLSAPISIGHPSQWECDAFITTTDQVNVNRSLGSKEKTTIIEPVCALDNVVCDYTSAKRDQPTTAVVVNGSIAGVFNDHVDQVSYIGTKCMKLCTIPTSVLDILVREDRVIAEKCHIARSILRCGHLDNVQLPSRPGLKPDYGRHTLLMGRTSCSKGWKFEEYFPSKLYPRGKRKQPYPSEDFKKGQPMSSATLTFLKNLRNPDVALRTLHHLSRLTEGGVGSRTRYLWQYAYEPGATAKCEIFPMRGAL